MKLWRHSLLYIIALITCSKASDNMVLQSEEAYSLPSGLQYVLGSPDLTQILTGVIWRNGTYGEGTISSIEDLYNWSRANKGNYEAAKPVLEAANQWRKGGIIIRVIFDQLTDNDRKFLRLLGHNPDMSKDELIKSINNNKRILIKTEILPQQLLKWKDEEHEFIDEKLFKEILSHPVRIDLLSCMLQDPGIHKYARINAAKVLLKTDDDALKQTAITCLTSIAQDPVLDVIYPIMAIDLICRIMAASLLIDAADVILKSDDAELKQKVITALISIAQDPGVYTYCRINAAKALLETDDDALKQTAITCLTSITQDPVLDVEYRTRATKVILETDDDALKQTVIEHLTSLRDVRGLSSMIDNFLQKQR